VPGSGIDPAGIVPGGWENAAAVINQQHTIHTAGPTSDRGVVRTAWMIFRGGTRIG